MNDRGGSQMSFGLAIRAQARSQSNFHRFVRAFCRNRAGVVGLLIIVLFVALATLGPSLAPHDPLALNLRKRFITYSPEHPLGTDLLGRDMLSRIMYGSRATFLIGVGSVGLALLIGSIIGLTGGYFRRLEPYVMRGTDIWLAFPTMVIALCVVAITGPGLDKVILAVALGQVPQFTRVMYSLTVVLREREFIAAARSAGAGDFHILWRHIFPNTIAPLIVQSSLFLPAAILTGAGLSFLGLGVQAPTPEWGLLLGVARSHIREAPHLMLYPGLAMMLVVIGFNLFGDALRDTLDPKTRKL